MTKHTSAGRPVVAIRVLASSAKSEHLVGEDKLLSGDIVEQVNVGGVILNAPFAGGKAGLQLELRRLYSAGDVDAQVKVRRLDGNLAKLQVCIVPHDSVMLKKQYVLKAVDNSNHIVTFSDSTEAESLSAQEKRKAFTASRLTNTQLQDGFVSYPWAKKVKQHKISSSVFSLLVIPSAPNLHLTSCNDVEDTVSRAMAWLAGAQASGIPINFLSIQTEPLLTKLSGQEGSTSTVSAGSWDQDFSRAMNKGIYGFEDYHGVDIGVLRAVRLWYVPTSAETPIFLDLQKGETRLGFGIDRTDEGFCYVTSVEEGTVADRAGLKTIYLTARAAGKCLVISRVSGEKITPTMVSSAGAIRCYDIRSISNKLSLHRQAAQPVTIHVLVSEVVADSATQLEEGLGWKSGSARANWRAENGSSKSVVLELVSDTESARSSDASAVEFCRDSDGELSFCRYLKEEFSFRQNSNGRVSFSNSVGSPSFDST